MPFISITRLRLRSLRFIPPFIPHTLRTLAEVRAAPGFTGGSLLADRRWAFWTMTSWDSESSMRAYVTSGAHRTAMPHLLDWCDEAAVVNWHEPDATLPSWPDAARRMREDGRVSRVRDPSPDHAGLTFAAPRVAAAVPIRRK